jgi:hypothetical protein
VKFFFLHAESPFCNSCNNNQKQKQKTKKICEKKSNPVIWWRKNPELIKTHWSKKESRVHQNPFGEEGRNLRDSKPHLVGINDGILRESKPHFVGKKDRILRESKPNFVGKKVRILRESKPNFFFVEEWILWESNKWFGQGRRIDS